jgi:hypothetical protein
VALLFSLAGAGIAAQRYLITSKSQIAPRVREKLAVPARMFDSKPVTVPPGGKGYAKAVCPPGNDADGGGFEVQPGGIVLESRPIGFHYRSAIHGPSWVGEHFDNAWRIKVMNASASSIEIVAWVSCRRIS